MFNVSDSENMQRDGKQTEQVKVKRNRKWLFIGLAAGVVVIAVVLLLIFVKDGVVNSGGDSVYGNTSGNLANGGFAAESDGWIYYSNAADGFSLYKVRPDGSEKTKLNDMISHNINVYDGWVYYLGPKEKEGSEEFFAEYGMIKAALHKTRTDGTETIKVSENANKFVMENGWIYYKNVGDATIKKMRTDGTQLTPVTDDKTDELTVADGWIYYRNRNDENALYKIRTDGTGKTLLDKSRAISINVLDGWVYYVDFNAEEANLPIYKIRTDGTEKTELTDSGGLYMNVSDGWIYYFCMEDGSLHKVRTDGTEDAVISNSSGDMINIAGGWIYYFYVDEEIKDVTSGGIELYRIKTDGTENQRVD